MRSRPLCLWDFTGSHRDVVPEGPPNNHHSQSLRPPLPPPHNHHQSSANSLNRNTLASRRGPTHAPSAAPGEGPSTPESVQLQDSWALNSSVPLETRHFLFKTPSGTTPLFSSSSPGYPLTSGTVYSPPPRLLPRNTFSRSSFKLNKPSKYCSWKCAAVSAIAAAVLLAVLLSYFIDWLCPGKHDPQCPQAFGDFDLHAGKTFRVMCRMNPVYTGESPT
ncbi:unnamed protein product [Coregonus sp. 'balchen']|nr:unnamed protein product [Coregonus sp. 'balchen']